MTTVEDDDISFVEIYVKLKNTFAFLWSNKSKIILAGLIGGVLGVTVSFFKVPQYESKLTFITEESPGGSSRFGAIASLASSFGLGGLSADGDLYSEANLMSYLKTKSIIEEALLSRIPGTKKTFAQEFIDVYKWNEDWEGEPELENISFPINDDHEKFFLQKDSILKEMYLYLTKNDKYFKVSKPNLEANIIEISVTTKSKLFSRYFPEELLRIVSQKYKDDKTSQARYTVNVIQKQVDSVRNVLNKSLLTGASETDQVFGLNPALNIERVSAAKEQIDVQVSSAVLEELIKNLELSKMQLLHQTPLIEVIDKPNYPLEVIEIEKVIGILAGGLISVFLMICYLFVDRFIKKIKHQL